MSLDSNSTRRDFLKLAAAATAYALAGGSMIANAKTEKNGAADLIITNARITTMDVRKPSASAVAIKDGLFLVVGSDDEAMAYRGAKTQVIDAGRRSVIPGLNDSHTHVIRGGLNYNMELRWDGVPSLADALRMLREQAKRTPPPQWVRIITPTARSRPSTTPRMEILSTPTMLISRDLKRGQGSRGSGAPEFPAIFPVPAGRSLRLPSL